MFLGFDSYYGNFFPAAKPRGWEGGDGADAAQAKPALFTGLAPVKKSSAKPRIASAPGLGGAKVKLSSITA